MRVGHVASDAGLALARALAVIGGVMWMIIIGLLGCGAKARILG